MKIRNLFAILFLLCLVLCCACAAAEKTRDYEYELNPDGTATITKYIGYATELTIPEELDGHVIICVGPNAFSECYVLTKVTISASVKSIGDYAFNNCGHLTNVVIPDGVTKIGRY